jgi:hypothetical protein
MANETQTRMRSRMHVDIPRQRILMSLVLELITATFSMVDVLVLDCATPTIRSQSLQTQNLHGNKTSPSNREPRLRNLCLRRWTDRGAIRGQLGQGRPRRSSALYLRRIVPPPNPPRPSLFPLPLPYNDSRSRAQPMPRRLADRMERSQITCGPGSRGTTRRCVRPRRGRASAATGHEVC